MKILGWGKGLAVLLIMFQYINEKNIMQIMKNVEHSLNKIYFNFSKFTQIGNNYLYVHVSRSKTNIYDYLYSPLCSFKHIIKITYKTNINAMRSFN